MTSNVEGLFTRHEFDADRVWTRQGDFAHMHCTARHLPSCGELVWRSEPIIERLLARMDPITQRWIPRPCQRVRRAQGQSSSTSARIRRSSRDRIWSKQSVAPAGSMQRCASRCSFSRSAPVSTHRAVVRYPSERLAAQHVNARFVRINREYPSVPAALTIAIGIAGDGGDVIGAIWKAWSGRSRTREA